MFRSIGVSGFMLALVFLFGLTQFFMPTTSSAQVERRVEVPETSRFDPVVITKVTVGDRVVQTGRVIHDPTTPFQGSADWIQNLTVYLYNRTDKTIVYAYLILGFPETGYPNTGTPESAPLACIVQLGRVPSTAPARMIPPKQPSDSQPITFLPGQTMIIHVSDYIDRIKARIEPVMTPAAVTQLMIHLDPLFFADGMFYGAGAYIAADPQNPGKEVHMERPYFPGNINHTWPGRPDWIDLFQAARKK